MIHFLKLEWLKLRNFQTFKISVILYIILLPLLFMAVQAMFLNNSQAALISNHLFKYPNIWDTYAYWASWLTFFILVYLSVLSISSEFTNKTLRQNLITGVERGQYLMGKGLIMVMLSLGATVYLFLITMLFCFINGGSGNIFSGIEILPRFFIQNLGYMSFAFMLAVLLRRSGLVMILFFAYVLIVERIIRYLIFLQLIDNLEIGSYFPASVLWDVVPFFMVNSAEGLDKDISRIMLDPWVAVGITVGYIALFWVITVRSFMRKDL